MQKGTKTGHTHAKTDLVTNETKNDAQLHDKYKKYICTQH